jgi:signal transduction histidine kinase
VNQPRRALRRLADVPVDVWAAVLLAALLILLGLVTRTPPMPGVQVLSSATLESADLPGGVAQVVSLPHVWNNRERNWGGQALYTLELPAERAADLGAADLALLLPRVGVRFRLLLNGQELLSDGWRRGPGYADTGTHAHLAPLPPALLAGPGLPDRLQIEIQGQPLRISGLGPVWLGPRDALEQRYRWLQGWQVNLTWMVAATGFTLGLLALLVWVNTAERLFGLLAGGLLALTVRLLLSTPIFLPGPFALWDYLHKLSFTWYCGFTYLFLAGLFRFRQSMVRRAVLGLMVVAPLWLGLVVWSGHYDGYRIWTGAIVVVCVLSLAKVLMRVRWGMGANQRLMVVVTLATLITGVRDFLVVQLGLPGDADIRWMTPGSMVLMFAMGWVLLRRTSEALDETRRLNAELARTVSEREAELHAAVERLRVAQTQRVLEAERRRLTRDMHDGLGSQLVQALNLVRSAGPGLDAAALEGMLNHALDELRLTLDSLEPMEGDLPTVLGMLRRRIEPALRGSGIELVWQVQEVPAVVGLEAQDVMHLFRCLQEVFANVAKHAQASRVTVRTGTDAQRVVLSVTDNGVGLGHLGQGEGLTGRGMSHIRLRAREMGAEVRFASAGPGTRVSLMFPIADLDENRDRPAGDQPETRRG